MKREPAVIVSTVTAFLAAILGLGYAFGADITEEQKNAVIGAVAPLVAVIFLLGPIVRSFVYSPASVEKIEAGAEPLAAEQSVPAHKRHDGR